jgi:hypothetical protein
VFRGTSNSTVSMPPSPTPPSPIDESHDDPPSSSGYFVLEHAIDENIFSLDAAIQDAKKATTIVQDKLIDRIWTAQHQPMVAFRDDARTGNTEAYWSYWLKASYIGIPPR